MNRNAGLVLAAPAVTPLLDPSFRPAALVHRSHRAKLEQLKEKTPVAFALEQADGSLFTYSLDVFPEDHPQAEGNFTCVERLLKFILWSRGGFRVYFSGPRSLGEALQRHYTKSVTGRFDAKIMGERIYERPFEVVLVGPNEIPSLKVTEAPLGRHLDGCRIGFDLGASDRKVAAVKDGKVVYSDEVVWDPVGQSDPQWHFDQIMSSLQAAAAHLPRVEAIGGSSAGVYVNKRVKVASLFRGVSAGLFEKRVKNLFFDLQKAWGDIPFELVNDGEVTALAGSMSMNDSPVLGIALGSSQAAGYVTREGNITSFLNELAFAPIDYSPQAPLDEWSGDRGCGVQYFSQQCVGRLMEVAGIEADAATPLPERLKHVQTLMEKGDFRARKIYETIGAYLGYGVAHYADFYDIKNVLILGRVTSGPGGDVILEKAGEVLEIEFPDLFGKINFRVPDEKDKRHGQAIAAASLPCIS
ncbi:MAG: ROK family protein [Opitutales bacterium]